MRLKLIVSLSTKWKAQLDRYEFTSAFQDLLPVDEVQSFCTYDFVITEQVAKQGTFILPSDRYSRISVVVQAGVTVQFVDAPVVGDSARILSVTLHQNAQVAYNAVQDMHLYKRYEKLTVTVHEHATFTHYEKHQEAAVTDKEYTYLLAGMGATVEYRGRIQLQGDQCHTLRCTQLHTAPHTTSTVDVKVVAQDAAQSIYEGAIVVQKQAVHAVAHQTHKALLLGKKAQVRSVPTLEVATNKVQCGHGSAIAPLDESYFFYGAMRGIPRASLQLLVVQGFLEF